MYCLIGLFVTNCTGTMMPMHTDEASRGIISRSYEDLKQLPEPESKVVAAVYRFRDQTGQYKPSENIASWSTAVTQGATSILIKSMEESGWFIPIEREGISNLLNERQIIQSIRNQNAGPNGPEPLPPLLFAGVILEGGVIGYDTNVITGGSGVRYMATGGSTNYRKDQVTIYLRAVSTQSGRVLKTVHTTKSIISQQLESGVFRYVDTNRILEAETGYTYNEPPVMAVTEAIDEAVKQLIVEGAEEGIWTPKDPQELEDYKLTFNFEKERQEQMNRNYFGLLQQENLRAGWFLNTNALIASHIGNYADPDRYAGFNLMIERSIVTGLSAQANFERTAVGANNAFSEPITLGELFLNGYLLPENKISPFISAGVGAMAYDKQHDFLNGQVYFTSSFKGGIDYRFNRSVGLKLSANYRYMLTDDLDGVTMEGYNDQFWSVKAGIVFKPKLWTYFN
ncbi:MAG: CsgG/HfaB family protein [Gracilimonas sp.]|nr:CsgG/HfaB family protein [Gracilimonas sp.]